MFSKILAKAGKREIGLKSASSCELDTFGIGIAWDCLKLFGNVFCSIHLVKIWAKSKKIGQFMTFLLIFINLVLICNKPQATFSF